MTLSMLGGYFRKFSPVPPAGRLNAGQKIWTILFVLFGLLSAATGAIMWLMQGAMQERISPDMHTMSITLHVFCNVFMVTLMLSHIYFSTLATPGGFGAMWGGTVKQAWVKLHHSVWYEKAAESSALSEERVRQRREKTLERRKKRIASARQSSALKATESRKLAVSGAEEVPQKDVGLSDDDFTEAEEVVETEVAVEVVEDVEVAEAEVVEEVEAEPVEEEKPAGPEKGSKKSPKIQRKKKE